MMYLFRLVYENILCIQLLLLDRCFFYQHCLKSMSFLHECGLVRLVSLSLHVGLECVLGVIVLLNCFGLIDVHVQL